jgi:hypothetical protein
MFQNTINVTISWLFHYREGNLGTVVPQKEGPWITVLLPHTVFFCPLWPASSSQP